MRKTILYLLLLVILAGGAYYFVFNKNESIFSAKETAFTVEDTADISKIFLARSNGETITLTRTDSGWNLNNKYRAHQGVLATFMRTLKLQQAQYPVPEAVYNGVIKSMAGNSVKTEVYDLKGNKITTFYVGGEGPNYSGTYMLQEHAQTPYLVKISGFDGILNPIYTTEIADWRNRNVFDLAPDEIKSISVQYPSEPLNSFTVHQDGKASVETAPGVPGSNPLNERRVKAYLKFFENVNCEGFLMNVPKMDSTISVMPKLCIIDLTSKKGATQHVEVYKMPINKRSKNLQTEYDDGFDADRFYAVMNHFKDTAVIQKGTFDKIFRKAYEFYEKDKPVEIMGVTKKHE